MSAATSHSYLYFSRRTMLALLCILANALFACLSNNGFVNAEALSNAYDLWIDKDCYDLYSEKPFEVAIAVDSSKDQELCNNFSDMLKANTIDVLLGLSYITFPSKIKYSVFSLNSSDLTVTTPPKFESVISLVDLATNIKNSGCNDIEEEKQNLTIPALDWDEGVTKFVIVVTADPSSTMSQYDLSNHSKQDTNFILLHINAQTSKDYSIPEDAPLSKYNYSSAADVSMQFVPMELTKEVCDATLLGNIEYTTWGEITSISNAVSNGTVNSIFKSVRNDIDKSEGDDEDGAKADIGGEALFPDKSNSSPEMQVSFLNGNGSSIWDSSEDNNTPAVSHGTSTSDGVEAESVDDSESKKASNSIISEILNDIFGFFMAPAGLAFDDPSTGGLEANSNDVDNGKVLAPRSLQEPDKLNKGSSLKSLGTRSYDKGPYPPGHPHYKGPESSYEHSEHQEHEHEHSEHLGHEHEHEQEAAPLEHDVHTDTAGEESGVEKEHELPEDTSSMQQQEFGIDPSVYSGIDVPVVIYDPKSGLYYHYDPTQTQNPQEGYSPEEYYDDEPYAEEESDAKAASGKVTDTEETAAVVEEAPSTVNQESAPDAGPSITSTELDSQQPLVALVQEEKLPILDTVNVIENETSAPFLAIEQDTEESTDPNDLISSTFDGNAVSNESSVSGDEQEEETKEGTTQVTYLIPGVSAVALVSGAVAATYLYKRRGRRNISRQVDSSGSNTQHRVNPLYSSPVCQISNPLYINPGSDAR